MFPPNTINRNNAIGGSSPSNSTLVAESPHSSINSSLSSIGTQALDSSPSDFDHPSHHNRSLSSYSPPSQSDLASPRAPTMEPSGSVMADITSDPYFHSPQAELPSLYQVAAVHEPDDDGNDAIALVLCRGGSNGAAETRGAASCTRAICGGGGPVQSPVVDEGGRLQYAESAFTDYHHLQQSHPLVDASITKYNHSSSRSAFIGQEPMLGGNSPRIADSLVAAAAGDSSALNSSSPSTRRLPYQMNPPDFLPSQIRNIRRTSSASASSSVLPSSNVYGGNVLDGVLSPMVDGCHQQPFQWYNVSNTDVPFESLLPSPVTLFPFPPTSASYCDPSNHFAFFGSPVSNVNSPSTPGPLHYLHQSQPHQQQAHQQERSVVTNQYFQVAQPHSYRNLHLTTAAHSSMNNMSQPFTGFAAQGYGGQNQKQAKKGGRRPKEEQMHLPPEEEEKRRQRRVRNKEAAARCRKRRLDHMTELSDQVAQLQETQAALEREIDQLAKEKEELEFVLKTHEPACRLRGQVSSVRSGPSPTKKFGQPAGITVSALPGGKVFAPTGKLDMECDDKTDPPLNPGAKVSAKFSGNASGNWNASSTMVNRPNTLHFGHDLDSPGIPIQTPSKIFPYDPLNMPTGLTPVSSGLTPIMSLASAAASLETPTVSVLGSLDGGSGSGGGSNAQKALQTL